VLPGTNTLFARRMAEVAAMRHPDT
jgi:hypothetical protein